VGGGGIIAQATELEEVNEHDFDVRQASEINAAVGGGRSALGANCRP
jgi:hypothetical protein